MGTSEMTTHNRFLLSATEQKAVLVAANTCVFVSHHQEDTASAKAIADYLLRDVQVDVYFDAYDPALGSAASANDEARIVDLIEAGLELSTHLLGVISWSTRKSWWVPFEIGSARGRHRPLAHVVLDDVSNLPSYLLKSNLLIDQVELASWARKLKLGHAVLSKSLDDFEPSLSIPRLSEARLSRPAFSVSP